MPNLTLSKTRKIDQPNRCRLSTELADQLNKRPDDHIRVESDLSKAYYIVDDLHEDTQSLQLSDDGVKRIEATVGDTVNVDGTVPIESRQEAFITGDIAETMWNRDSADVFITCPHGGDIEYNTDEMGMYLFKKLQAAGIESTAWILHGYYSGDDKDAFKRWHVKKPVRASKAYPELQKLVDKDRSFQYGVGFHIHRYDYVAIGGMADQQIREKIADSIRDPLPSKYDIVTDYDEMALTGKGTTMSMNYFAEDYQGIQIEMPWKVAYNKFHSIPKAVSDVLIELVD